MMQLNSSDGCAVLTCWETDDAWDAASNEIGLCPDPDEARLIEAAPRLLEAAKEVMSLDIPIPPIAARAFYLLGQAVAKAAPAKADAIPPVSGGSPDAGDSPSFANDLIAASIWLGEPVPPEAGGAIDAAVLPAEDREACFLAALESDETGEMLALVRHLKSLPLPRVERAINILTGGADPAEVEAAREHAKGCKVAKCIKCGRGIL